MSPKTWSVILCSIEAAKFAHVVQCYERVLAGRDFEIIAIHDARSLAEAYNRGIARARGEILVFSHDDILILDDSFADKIEQRLTAWDVLGFAGATQLADGYWWSAGGEHLRGVVAHAPPGKPDLSLHLYGITQWGVDSAAALDGLCLIASRDALGAHRFDADTFDGFHLYDLDFSFGAHLRGLRVGVLNDIPILHMSPGHFGEAWRRQRQHFVRKYASTLNIDPDQPLPDLTRLRASVALFQTADELRAFWQPGPMQRAVLAAQRRAA